MDGYLILVLVVLVLLSAFFSASETAISTINRIRMRNLADEGNKKAQKAIQMADNYDRTLSTILVGNNIVNIAFASLSTMLFTSWFGVSGVGIATLVSTVVVLVFGEVLPKSLAKEFADSFALAVSYPLYYIMILLTPIVYIFIGIKKELCGFSSHRKSRYPLQNRSSNILLKKSKMKGFWRNRKASWSAVPWILMKLQPTKFSLRVSMSFRQKSASQSKQSRIFCGGAFLSNPDLRKQH